MIYKNQEYFKGYHITKTYIAASNNIQLGDYFLGYDDEIKVTKYEGKNKFVLLGYAVNPYDIEQNELEILKEIDNHDKESRLTSLNKLNGRYVLLTLDDDHLSLYPDATTMLPVFYHEEFPVIASHSLLVANIVEDLYEVQVDKFLDPINGFMDFSKYKQIFKLNPNMFYDFETQETIRFYPSKNYQSADVSEVMKKTIKVLENLKKWMKSRESYLTITAGIDSRVSLAIMHDKELPLLTYNSLTKNKSRYARITYKNDVEIVKKMVDDLDLNHTLLEIDGNDKISEETKSYVSIFESTHSFSLSEKMKMSDFRGKFHIKSNIFELAKLPVPIKFYNDRSFEYIKEILKKAPKDIMNGETPEEIIEKYCQRNDINQEKCMGYYYPDLFYQEQRLGNWHSNITQETDNSVEIFIFLNSREVLDLLIRTNIDLRRDWYLQREWINDFWAVLNFYPVNTLPNLYEQSKKLQTGSCNENFQINGDTIQTEGNYVMPKFPMVTDSFKFVIENILNDEQQLTIESHYKNVKGRGKIMLKHETEIYDYTLMNDIKLKFKPHEKKEFEIVYDKIYDRKSWQQAGRLTFK